MGLFFIDLTWFYRIDINLYVAALLLMLLLISMMKLDHKEQLNRSYFLLVALVALMLIIEAVTCIFTAFPAPWQVPISVAFHIILYACAPFLAAYWIYSLHKMLDIVERRPSWPLYVLFLPSFINAIFAISSIWTKWYFYFDSSFIYHRGTVNFLPSAILVLYLLAAFIYICRSKSILDRQEFHLLLIATLIPLGGVILQGFLYGILIAWGTIGISILFVYLFLAQRLVAIDRLTGAWSRDSFDFKITQRVFRKKEQSFGAIYFDLDHLKQINDQYGHHEGDSALKNTVACVKRVLEKDQIIARLGGDEFIVITFNTNEILLDELKQKIRKSLDAYNQATMKPYQLNISIGVDIYRHQYETIEEFINHIDELMYVDKRAKKTAG